MNQLCSILPASALAVALMNPVAAADVSRPEPAAGPARESGLQCLGQLRVRRSEEIGDSRWGVSCCWIADEHLVVNYQYRKIFQIRRILK